MKKKLLVTALGLAALVLNPVAACSMFHESAPSPAYEFGARELRGAIEGTWRITAAPSPEGGSPVEYTVVIAQGRGPVAAHASGASGGASLVAAASACSEGRTFVSSASACADEVKTTMPLEIQIVRSPSRGESGGGESGGKVWVDGTTFVQAQLEARVDGNILAAVLTPGGTVADARMVIGRDHRVVTMVRIPKT